MKHILNNLSEEEKNAIREQHSGGMKVELGKFKQMVEKKLGDVRPFVNEQNSKSISVKIYDDEAQSKFLDSVFVVDQGKMVGSNGDAEFPAVKVSNNSKGTLQIQCMSPYQKFYFFEKDTKITLNGYNKEMSKQLCSSVKRPYVDIS